MKYIDFWVQSLILIVVLGILVAGVGGKDTVIMVLWMQLLLGPWQVTSSILSVGFRAPFFSLKAVHLIVSAIYLSILSVSPIRELPREASLLIVMVPAWTLAIYYYVVTAIVAFYKPPRLSSFLPHTSF